MTPFWFIDCGTSSEVTHITLFGWSCSYNYFVHRAVFQFTSKQGYQMYFGFRSSDPGGNLGQLYSCCVSLSKHILTPVTKLNISNHWICQWRLRSKNTSKIVWVLVFRQIVTLLIILHCISYWLNSDYFLWVSKYEKLLNYLNSFLLQTHVFNVVLNKEIIFFQLYFHLY